MTTISACSSDSKADGTVDVVAAFYPLQFVAERVGGAAVKVTNLARPGVEPHDLELEPKQLAGIADADLALYLKGFQPAVDEAVEAEAKKTSFDVATVQPLDDAADGEENGKDPHVWLDPTRLATIADQVAERLAAVDKDNADAYKLGAVKLKIDLTALDEEYTKGLQNCARTDIVTSHAAFGYLAKRYNLTQVPISGLSPEAEPSPQRVAEVAALAKEKGVTTIFFETLVSPKVAQTLATEVGARAEVLDPIEGLRADAAPGEDYLSVMRQNLTKLREALGCR
ncbi:zinc ABC transporter substrate-binding protein [Virgisporangium aurantiacum]|uniref:Zinc ABC transporter substrate-binding protein n=1 Tax=Virgisporangium aurantiacum TaxID=175570 RepID=A0A8J4E3X4_9ACTN|nr:zinc ABC transporter substrate-binding protein [Virgisporangium aurantiacum]